MRPADWIHAVTGEPIEVSGQMFVPVRLGVAVYLRIGPIEHEIGTLTGGNPVGELPALLEAVAAELRERMDDDAIG